MRERVVGWRADSGFMVVLVLVLAVVVVVVLVVEGNDGVGGDVPRWDIGAVEEDGWIMLYHRVSSDESLYREGYWK